MMLRGKRLAMTLQTFAAEIIRLLGRARLRMRIMTAPAPHPVAGFPFARAQGQRFKLAQRLRRLRLISREQEIMLVVGKPLSGLKVIEMLPRLLDRRGSLKVTLHSDRVAPLRSQLRRIHNRTLSLDVSAARPMTALASDPRMR